MTESLLGEFKQKVASLKLVPSTRGRYEVYINGELVFSKVSTGRFPEIDEIKGMAKAKV